MDNKSLVHASDCAVLSDGLHVLTTLARMQEAKPLWRDLDRRSTADLVWFQSFDWCDNWIRQLDVRQHPYILMLVEKGKAVAVLPMMLGRNRLGVSILRILGEPHTQYGNILTENGLLSNNQLQLLQAALAVNTGSDCLVCNYVPAGSPLEQVLGDAHRMTRLDNQSMLVDLSQFSTATAFDESLSKNTQKNLRRRRKHLQDLGSLTFQVLRPLDASYATAVADCIEMKRQWLTATGRFGFSLQKAGHAAFLKGIPQQAQASEGPLAFVLSLAGKPIAIEIGFLQRGHYYSYMGAFDWQLRQQAPGRLQMHETIGWLIGQGATSMDLLANPTDYKRDIASRSIALASYSKSHTLRGHAYASFWTGWGKPQLKRTLAAIPQRWRAGFNHVKKLEFSN